MKGFWKRKLPACLLALAMMVSVVPAVSAASPDWTYDVDEDDYVWLNAADFQDIYEYYTDGNLESVEFTEYDDFDDYGYFTFEDFDGYKYDADYDELSDYTFYYYREYWDDIDLGTLKFNTYDYIDSDTLDFEVRLVGSKKTVYADIRIDIEGGSKSSSGDVELTYYVDSDDDVEFDAGDFKELFDEESRETFEYLDFYGYDDFDGYGYFEAKDADGDWTELNEDDLEDGYYYYDWNDTYSW